MLSTLIGQRNKRIDNNQYTKRNLSSIHKIANKYDINNLDIDLIFQNIYAVSSKYKYLSEK